MLASGVEYFRQADLIAIPIWRMAHDAGASIAGAARRLGVGAVLVGTSQRSAVWHLLRGNVLKSLVRELPKRDPGLDLQLTEIGDGEPSPLPSPAYGGRGQTSGGDSGRDRAHRAGCSPSPAERERVGVRASA